MANVFEGVWNALKHPLDEAQFLFDVGRGKIDLKDAPGEHQRMMNKTTVPILGDNKIAKNSDAIAGTIVGGILAAPAIGSAMGGASQGALGNVAPSFELGNVGNYFKPGTEFGGGGFSDFVGMDTPSFDISQGAGWKPGSTEGMDLMENGGKYTPTTEFGGAEKKKYDFSKMADVLKSIVPNEDTPQVSQASHRGGGFRFDKSLYEDPLLAREYQQLYMEPLYKNLI